MIVCRNVRKAYGDRLAVDDLTLAVRPGEIYGFLGPNGAGKTTTIRMLVGLLAPSSGRIEIDGMDLAARPPAARALTGYIPDRPYVYDKLTGIEFLRFAGELYGMAPAEAERKGSAWLARFDLADDAGRRTEHYSHGMRQKLVFASILLREPRLLVVDEPMVGLDPRSVRLVKDILREQSAAGVTVFLSTHTLSVAEELCGRIGIIHRGRLVAEGTAERLRALAGGRAGRSGADLETVFLTLTAEEAEAAAGGAATP